jgi:hypothetical protein
MAKPLRVDTTRQLTYVIYWRPNGKPNGHASMIIDSSKADGTDILTLMRSLDATNYVSWVSTGGPVAGNVGVRRGHANTYDDDRLGGWGGKQIQGLGTIPTRWVALTGLDIAAMDQEWSAIRNKQGGSHWKLIDKNCATVVARVLKEGCAPVGAQGSWYTRNPVIWTPDGVMRFAKSLTNWIADSSTANAG